MSDIREYTPFMGEISGFGGGYEAACRAMVLAAVDWLEADPSRDPKFHGFKDVYGICIEDNADAKAMSDVMVKAAGGDCTGAMHQACVGHALNIKANGWQKYVEEMSKPDEEEKSHAS